MGTRGERLRQALAARGVRKQMALAAELGVDESTISRWRHGQGLSLDHAARLCDTLEISLDWLILGRGEMDLLPISDSAGSPAVPADAFAFLPAPVREAISNLALAIAQELGSKPDWAESPPGSGFE